MASFLLEPPALLGAGTTRRRLAGWLRDRLAARGVVAFGPFQDLRGWRLVIPADDGFVSIRFDGRPGGRFAVRLDREGDAEAEYEDALAACEDALAMWECEPAG